MDPTTLETIWFLLICVLWTGYFVLEGFDFGVGMLLHRVGKTPEERTAVVRTIGPVWDANEVWLLTAGGATFAAFPGWYATLFSGFYLALFAILLGLILRGVALEFRAKREDAEWRRRWEYGIAVGSLLPAILWGVGWANIVDGVPLDSNGEYAGNFFDLLTPYTLAGGVVTALLFAALGAVFLSLRLTGKPLARATALARPLGGAAALAVAVWGAWSVQRQTHVEWLSALLFLLAGAAAVVAAVLAQRRHGWAFVLLAGTVALLFSALWVDLFPLAMASSGPAGTDLALHAVASQHYTLKVMTVVAVSLVPVVLLYQGWTYWVFRQRVSPQPEAAAGGRDRAPTTA